MADLPPLPAHPPVFSQPKEGAKKKKPKKKGISTQAAKAKGRRLQQKAAREYRAAFPELDPDDCRSLSMGAQGDDLILSRAARARLPYAFEMKNVEDLTLWEALRQVMKRAEYLPCVVTSKNFLKEPAVTVPFGHLLHLLRFEATPAGGGGGVEPPLPELVTTAEVLALFELRAGDRHHALRQAVEAGIKYAVRDVGAVADADGGELALAGGRRVTMSALASVGFWTTWDRLRKRKDGVPILVLNRGDPDAPIYATIPFGLHVRLLRARWAHLQNA